MGRSPCLDVRDDVGVDGAVKLYCKAGEIRWTDLSEITKGKDIVDKYKVFISKSAGSPGKDLKIIGTPYIGERGTACTDSLFPIGDFDTFDEANNLQKYIKTQFLIESMFICALGGIFGIIIGYSVSIVLGNFLNSFFTIITGMEMQPPVLSMPVSIGAMLVSTIVGVIFGVYPAGKAAKLDPIEALRYE